MIRNKIPGVPSKSPLFAPCAPEAPPAPGPNPGRRSDIAATSNPPAPPEIVGNQLPFILTALLYLT